jgi:hypothetical protein
MKDNAFAEDKAYSLIRRVDSESFKWVCPECDNRAEELLEIITPPQPDFYCHQCSHDLKRHGIASKKEEEPEHV